MTCEDCIHYDACADTDNLFSKIVERDCNYFKDASRFIELPCKLGTKVYRVLYLITSDDECYMSYSKEWVIRQGCFTLSDLSSFGETVFCTDEEAQIALHKLQNKSTV